MPKYSLTPPVITGTQAANLRRLRVNIDATKAELAKAKAEIDRNDAKYWELNRRLDALRAQVLNGTLAGPTFRAMRAKIEAQMNALMTAPSDYARLFTDLQDWQAQLNALLEEIAAQRTQGQSQMSDISKRIGAEGVKRAQETLDKYYARQQSKAQARPVIPMEEMRK